MKKIIIGLFLFICISCSNKSTSYSIAIDKGWYSVVLNGQTDFLNGFITDLLLEIAKENKIEINLISTNWDTIFDGLNMNKYQAIFSVLDPYNFNRAKYDFSSDIIKTGFVLVISKKQNYKNLGDLKEKHVGYLRGSNSLIFLQKNIQIFDETYDSIPVMLEDITKMKIEGAVLSIIPAYRYVKDLFYNDLKMVLPPINAQAIRLLTLKGQNKRLLILFNKSLEKLQKNGKLKELETKWGLPN